METRRLAIPHSQLIETLFMHKKFISKIFQEVLGLYGIDYIAVAHINASSEFFILSSLPALEFKNITSGLWAGDNSFNADWYEQKKCSAWKDLYEDSLGAHLMYERQNKFALHNGVSLSMTQHNGHSVIFFGTQKDDLKEQEIFTTQVRELTQVAAYCTKELSSYLLE